MNLIRRPVRPQDFSACLDLLDRSLPLDEKTRCGLVSLWDMLEEQGLLMTALVEERDAPGQPLAFGFSVFVTDEFMSLANLLTEPKLVALLLEQHEGGRSPVLDIPTVRRANGGRGLNMLNLLYAFDEVERDHTKALLIRREINLAFHEVHRGYYYREILGQGYAEDMPFLLMGGWHLRRDFSPFYADNAARGSAPPPQKWLSLIGLTRDEAAVDGFSNLAVLFHSAPPCLGLKTGEQELLRRALLGQTDEELAAALGVTPSAVKKRWGMIYGRVGMSGLCLLPEWPTNGAVRGAEKRRHLLQYLRDHPEELRPHD